MAKSDCMLAILWLLRSRHRMTAQHAALLVEESTLASYVPHLLLSFGRSLRVLTPDSLKRRLVDVIEELGAHYRALH